MRLGSVLGYGQTQRLARLPHHLEDDGHPGLQPLDAGPVLGREHADLYQAAIQGVQLGEQTTEPHGHQGPVNAVCAVTVAGRPMLASGGNDDTVRIWDPATGEQTTKLHGYQGWVNAVCAVTVDGRPMLASGGNDGTVRIWDPATGERITERHGRRGPVKAVCAVTVDGRPMLASGGDDRTVRIWDPATRRPLMTVPTHYPLRGITEVGGLLGIGLEVGLLVIELLPRSNSLPAESSDQTG